MRVDVRVRDGREGGRGENRGGRGGGGRGGGKRARARERWEEVDGRRWMEGRRMEVGGTNNRYSKDRDDSPGGNLRGALQQVQHRLANGEKKRYHSTEPAYISIDSPP